MQSSQQILQKLTTSKLHATKENRSVMKRVITYSYDWIKWGHAGAKFIFNRNTVSFLCNRNWLNYSSICQDIPHVRSGPLGHLGFTKRETDKFTKAAAQTGMSTYWAGPVFPVLYVTSNAIRRVLVREGRIGVINKETESLINWMSGGNRVMSGFILFHSLESKTHKQQRHFLSSQFHVGAPKKLPMIAAVTQEFLQTFYLKHGQQDFSVREFITGLVLHTSSYLLGLTNYTLDEHYFDDRQYREDIARIACYGISSRADPIFEKRLYEIFVEIFQHNFDLIQCESGTTHVIQNIFASMDIPFPNNLQEFYDMSEHDRYAIAMNFAATCFGAMVHSTANTLDWAMATLLNEPEKMKLFTQLMETCDDNLSDMELFDDGGKLSRIADFVIQNVIDHPPFAYEFFYCQNSFTATLTEPAEGGKTQSTTITVPDKSFIVVNYTECNKDYNKEKFQANMQSLMTDPEVASFGGSDTSKKENNNKKTRLCPAARTSLYEQAIMIAFILRHFVIHITKKVSCEQEAKEIPLCVRVNEGSIQLKLKKGFKHLEVSEFKEFIADPDAQVQQSTLGKYTR